MSGATELGLRAPTRRLGVAAAIGVTAAGVVRGGGFFTPDLVAIPFFLCISAALAWRRSSHADLRLQVALAAFGAYWLARGFAATTQARASSLTCAAVAFAASYTIARTNRTARERLIVLRSLVLTGVLVALVSLGRWAAHQDPWGLPFDGIWRLAGPFAYPNAAGLFFALVFIANLARNERTWFDRVFSAAILFGALAATASRGAIVATVAGTLVMGVRGFAPMSRVARVLLVTVASGALIVTIYVGLITFGVVGTTRAQSASASLDDRVAEMSAAARQGGSNMLVGVGPERDLLIHNFRGDAVARYAHNEPLQIFAGGGLIGVVLLAVVVGAAVGVARDDDKPRGRLCVAALTAFAIGGLLDFNWHFVGLAAFAGWLVGLDEDPSASPTG